MVMLYGQVESEVLTNLPRVTQTADQRVTSALDNRITADAQLNLSQSFMTALGHIVGFDPFTYVKESGTWKQALPWVKYNGSWQQPLSIHKKLNGNWVRVF